MKFMSKLAFVPLAVCFLVLSVYAVPSMNLTAESIEELADPIGIMSLSEIADMAGDYYLLTDITAGEDFVSIGTEEEPFTGTFNGKGYTVTDLPCPLFYVTKGATIQDVSVTNASFNSGEVFGAVVAKATDNTFLWKCSFSGSITLDNSGISTVFGGIVGICDKDSSILNCNSNVTVSYTGNAYLASLGGIVGENRGTVKGCISEGSLVAVSDKYKVNLGGIAGENTGKIEECFSHMTLEGKASSEASGVFAGGIAGFNNGGSITNSSSTGSITAHGKTVYPSYSGGIAGLNINGSISVAKSTSELSTVHSFTGGITGYSIGHKGTANINDVLYMSQMTLVDSVSGGITATALKTDEDNSTCCIAYALNLSSAKAVGYTNAQATEIYSMGETDGISAQKSGDLLKENGISELENHAPFWVGNTEVSAFPDLLIPKNSVEASIIVSNIGDNGDIAYYLYNPTSSECAKAFTAVYYNGSQYIGMDYVENISSENYARLKATDVPEGTTRIKFIAFAKTFDIGFVPARVDSVQIQYTYTEGSNET